MLTQHYVLIYYDSNIGLSLQPTHENRPNGVARQRAAFILEVDTSRNTVELHLRLKTRYKFTGHPPVLMDKVCEAFQTNFSVPGLNA
jgi:hypothetical protein